jgi:hypothetical protein
MLYEQCNFRGNVSVAKGTSLPWPNRGFRPFSASHCSGVTETLGVALCSYALRAVQVCSKSLSSDGHLPREAEQFFRPYLSSHCSGVTQTSQAALPTHALQSVHVWPKSVGNEGHFTWMGK